MKLLVGILASNQKAKTIECLESLHRSAWRGFDVFLVDNASPEQIGDAVRASGMAEVSVRPRNTGCAGGRNLILRRFEAGTWPYLLFLDNDAQVRPDTLGHLFDAAECARRSGARLGAIGPHVLYAANPNRLWCAGGARIDWDQCRFTDSGQNAAAGDPAFGSARPLDTLAGGFMLVTRDAVRATGEFETRYVIYVEDTDWCWRMKLAGHGLQSAPRAVCLHHPSSSLGSGSPRFHFYRIRNRLWFFQAYSPLGAARARHAITADAWRGTIRMELGSRRPRAAFGAALGWACGLQVPAAIRARTRAAENGAAQRDGE